MKHIHSVKTSKIVSRNASERDTHIKSVCSTQNVHHTASSFEIAKLLSRVKHKNAWALTVAATL